MRFVRLLLKTLGALLAIVILAIVALIVYPLIRPAAKTVRPVTTISISTPIQIRRSFIDYLTVGGSRLYAGCVSHGMVGVIDTATNRTIASIGGLGRVHGIALAPVSNLGFACSSGDNNVNVFDLIDPAAQTVVAAIPLGG